MTTPCPRCGEPVGKWSKTGMCQHCAAGLAAWKRGGEGILKWRSPSIFARSRRRKPAPVTLATKA